jgi:hypothetical protein
MRRHGMRNGKGELTDPPGSIKKNKSSYIYLSELEEKKTYGSSEPGKRTESCAKRHFSSIPL